MNERVVKLFDRVEPPTQLTLNDCHFNGAPITLEIRGYKPRSSGRLVGRLCLAVAALLGKEIARPVVVTNCLFTGPPMSLWQRTKAVFLGCGGPMREAALRIDDRSSRTGSTPAGGKE